ncbi:hypothetical protein, conserved [Trypanosoma brucei gambiense DAL972]|uniref:Uncharacterized protein n=1 Tax=Trypanosoma brucei gambiense (strain MHOM/CI/86/DAL972) TaxID=679716 RepID=D0A6H1_TRYB9|nr:hypothetical protein, conserved [Trypanosoma brucei gambiense DAL972]CBH17272.1 hypothetical protein, conserved [Trypanosoma brucei gambiense DAL972]|eukprot:XP_011779536.1 hypothetical protein, conserved [Trypanosoma brucei gambiense DAL972]
MLQCKFYITLFLHIICSRRHIPSVIPCCCFFLLLSFGYKRCMWTRRNVFPLMSLRDAARAPVVISPQAKNGGPSPLSPTAKEECKKSDSIVSMNYTLIPGIMPEEAVMILSWALCIDDPMAVFGKEGIEAFRQVEYFFAGTSGGRLFVYPLVPPAMRPFLPSDNWEWLQGEGVKQKLSVPWNAGPRRLFHQHRYDEPVTAIAILGRLVVSCSTDMYVHMSLFHPTPHHILTIRHPSPLRCVLLWEGAVFASRLLDSQRRAQVASAECCVVYLITGDDGGVARIWRSNVEAGEYFLVAVLAVVTSTCYVGFATPLHYIAREDADAEHSNRRPTAETTRQTKAIYSLAVDDDRRLIAGVEGGVVVWSLADLPYKQKEKDHLLCWDEERMVMEPQATSTLRIRGQRLMNMTVWVKSAAFTEECLSSCRIDQRGRSSYERGESTNNHAGESVMGDADGSRKPPFHTDARWSSWKPKYGTHVAGGLDVGVVSNVVCMPSLNGDNLDERGSAESLLRAACAPIIFPSLKNIVHFPLWVVEPVFAPMRILSLTGSICTALLVLVPSGRVVTGGSDGVVTLWLWDVAEATYVRAIVSERPQSHSGLCRCLTALREPDIFTSCGYEDGIIKEWHVYDEPELLIRLERSFALQSESSGKSSTWPAEQKQHPFGVGVSCAVSFPAFCALFVVGVDECHINTFGLLEVLGCKPPPDYIFDGYKTVRVVPSSHDTHGIDKWGK